MGVLAMFAVFDELLVAGSSLVTAVLSGSAAI